jgi:hypothetical protein
MFGLKNDVDIGAPDMEVSPSIYYTPINLNALKYV